MEKVALLLNEMMKAGIITNYAIFGAVAQMRYTEAVVTLDADVLVAIPESHSLDVLSPVYVFCKEQGYLPEGEAIRVGLWPVQFIPVFNALTEEAMRMADSADLEGIPLRVVRADYLAAIALSVGRAKDFARILALIESKAVSHEQISSLAEKHNLVKQWELFRRRFDEV